MITTICTDVFSGFVIVTTEVMRLGVAGAGGGIVVGIGVLEGKGVVDVVDGVEGKVVVMVLGGAVVRITTKEVDTVVDVSTSLTTIRDQCTASKVQATSSRTRSVGSARHFVSVGFRFSNRLEGVGTGVRVPVFKVGIMISEVLVFEDCRNGASTCRLHAKPGSRGRHQLNASPIQLCVDSEMFALLVGGRGCLSVVVLS